MANGKKSDDWPSLGHRLPREHGILEPLSDALDDAVPDEVLLSDDMDESDQTDLGASDDRPLGPDHILYRRL